VLSKMWITFFMIYNASRIPKLPRMLATKYDSIPPEVVDVMRRLGIRDPRGIQVAMKHYNVTSIKDLVAILEYQKPKRNIRRRLWLAFARIVGETDMPTFSREIRKQPPSGAKLTAQHEIINRIKIAQKELRDER
jgi:hypothetical protein